MVNVIRVKPHHFIDIITSVGAGQTKFEPHPYGHAVHTVARRVLRNRDSMLQMDLGADDICAPCKHNVNGLCDDTIDTSFRPKAPTSKREFNLLIDQRWCQRLGLKPGERLTARQFCERLRASTGDLTGIYLEEPAERTASRSRNLAAGIETFLGHPA